MNVIFDSSNRNNRDPLISPNPNVVGPKLLEKLRGNEIAPVDRGVRNAIDFVDANATLCIALYRPVLTISGSRILHKRLPTPNGVG
jgi:hypothetical protein